MDDTLFRVAVAVIAVVPAVVGVVLLAGLPRSRTAALAVTRGAVLPAVVVDNQQHSWQDGRMTFSPVVRFRDAGGTERTPATGDSAPTSWVRGSAVGVQVSDDRPDLVLLAGSRAAGARRFGSAFGAVVGVLFVAFGVGVWVLGGHPVAGGSWAAGPFGHAPTESPPDLPFDVPGFPGS